MERPVYFKKFYRVTLTGGIEQNFESESEAKNYFFSCPETQRRSCMEIIPSGGPGYGYWEGQRTIYLGK